MPPHKIRPDSRRPAWLNAMLASDLRPPIPEYWTLIAMDWCGRLRRRRPLRRDGGGAIVDVVVALNATTV